MITAHNILHATADHFDIKVKDLTGPSRKDIFSQPRLMAYYVIHKLTDMSLPQIGRAIGNRHHTTIMGGIKAVESRMTPATRTTVEAIKAASLREAEIHNGGMFRTRRNPPVFKSHRTEETA